MSSINPEARAHFKANAYSTENIKQNRDRITGLATCAHCWIEEYKVAAPLKRCGKCKSRFYCSRQCQKADWESHKSTCKEESPAFHKLEVNLISNAYLMHLLGIWLILEFRLLEDPSRAAAKTPLFASMCVGIEPEDFRTTAKLLASDLTSSDEGVSQAELNITGMLQVHHLETLSEQTGDPTHLELWRKAKEDFSGQGYLDYPVVIVQMFKGDDQTAMAASIPLHPAAFNAVRKNESLVYYSGITGQKLERPMNADNVLNMLNQHIRADTRNQLLLRTKMTDGDMQLILDAQKLKEPKEYVKMFRDKITREFMDN